MKFKSLVAAAALGAMVATSATPAKATTLDSEVSVAAVVVVVLVSLITSGGIIGSRPLGTFSAKNGSDLPQPDRGRILHEF